MYEPYTLNVHLPDNKFTFRSVQKPFNIYGTHTVIYSNCVFERKTLVPLIFLIFIYLVFLYRKLIVFTFLFKKAVTCLCALVLMTNGIEVKEEQVEQQSDAEATNAEEGVTETDKKQEKRGTHESHDYHVHEQKTVTIVKKVPVPYPVEKHIPVPVEKIVHYPVKVGVPKPYPVYKTVHYPVKKIIKVPVHIPQRRFFHTNFLIIKRCKRLIK